MTSNRSNKDSARAGRNKPAPSPTSSPSDDVATGPLTVELLHAMMTSLKTDVCGDICSKIDTLSVSLRSEISLVRDDLKKSIETVQNKLDAQGAALSELERSSSDHSTGAGS